MIMRTAIRSLGGAGLALLTLTGCSLGRASQPLEQYVLGGTSVTQHATPSNATSSDAWSSNATSSDGWSSNATSSGATSPVVAGLTIGLRRLDLAPYLASPAIVLRRGAHQIVTSEYHRWGEDLGAGINRAVAGYLIASAAADGVRAVDVAPWPARARHDYLVQLHVARFEGTAAEDPTVTAGEAHVQATWEIIRQADGAVLARGLTSHVQAGWRIGDYAALVTMLDGGLIALAGELTDCLRRLEGDRAGMSGAAAGGVAADGAAAGGAIAPLRELSCGAVRRP
jgi:uncharacterized lipoprotein YmbA